MKTSNYSEKVDIGGKCCKIKEKCVKGNGKYDQIVDELLEGVKLGDPECAYKLGVLLESGYLGYCDNEMALLCYEMGVKQYHVKSAYKAAKLLYFGDGVARDHVLAVQYLKIGLDQSDANCQCLMGAIYEIGSDCFPSDEIKAFEYYSLAAEQGEEIARFALGRFYLKGFGGIKRDKEKSIHFFEGLAMENYPGAHRYLAHIYAGLEQYEESLKWALEGAKQGDIQCQLLVDYFYYKKIKNFFAKPRKM